MRVDSSRRIPTDERASVDWSGHFPGGRQPESYSETGPEKVSNPAKSAYNKGTIRGDVWYLVVSKDVRRHRLISIDYITTLPCHGRGREFESRRPRHSFTGSRRALVDHWLIFPALPLL